MFTSKAFKTRILRVTPDLCAQHDEFPQLSLFLSAFEQGICAGLDRTIVRLFFVNIECLVLTLCSSTVEHTLFYIPCWLSSGIWAGWRSRSGSCGPRRSTLSSGDGRPEIRFQCSSGPINPSPWLTGSHFRSCLLRLSKRDHSIQNLKEERVSINQKKKSSSV